MTVCLFGSRDVPPGSVLAVSICLSSVCFCLCSVSWLDPTWSCSSVRSYIRAVKRTEGVAAASAAAVVLMLWGLAGGAEKWNLDAEEEAAVEGEVRDLRAEAGLRTTQGGGKTGGGNLVTAVSEVRANLLARGLEIRTLSIHAHFIDLTVSMLLSVLFVPSHKWTSGSVPTRVTSTSTSSSITSSRLSVSHRPTSLPY